MNKFASTIVNDNNLDEIHDKYWNKVRYIHLCNEVLPGDDWSLDEKSLRK